MSTSDLPPEAQAVLDRADATLRKVQEEAALAGLPVLAGDCTVSLHIDVDAATPVHAVDELIFQLLNNGMRSYVFQVRDHETGNVYGVSDGKIIDLTEKLDG